MEAEAVEAEATMHCLPQDLEEAPGINAEVEAEVEVEVEASAVLSELRVANGAV